MSIPIEEWEMVKGFEGKYQISNKKRVRSIIKHSTWGKNKILKHSRTLKNGIKCYQFRVLGEMKYFREDKMFREAFPNSLESKFIEKAFLRQELSEDDIIVMNTHLSNVIETIDKETCSKKENGKLIEYVLSLQKWINQNK